ncbi:MAG: HAD-IC family P-type ATPase [Allosphingosinicella sp.]
MTEKASFRPHAAAWEEAARAVDAGTQGLGAAEAARRLARYGPNRLPEAKRPTALFRFLKQFHNVLIYVLIASAGVTAALGHPVDTGVIVAVVIANALIGYIQEGRAERAMDAIRGMLAPHTSVLRDGRRQVIASADVVPGDVVLLEAGEKVPADLRLFEAQGLRVQEAVLTGESIPVEKDVAPAAADAPLGDRHSMSYGGTLVAAGTGRGIAVATGADTEIGRISGMLAGVETLTTPLVRQMDGFARWLSLLILTLAGLLLAYSASVAHLPFEEAFMTVVGLSVAAIPEGLPATLTITLAIGVQTMARRNAIVRRLPAIETIGAVSVICTDKTGTLTRNEMVATAIAAAGQVYSVAGAGYAAEGAVTAGADPVEVRGRRPLLELAHVATLCNDAVLHWQEGGWEVAGDPMEGALLALAGKLDPEGGIPAHGWRRLAEIPFDSRHRYMATLDAGADARAIISVKGAPEQVLALCADQRAEDGGVEPLDTSYWHEKVEELAGGGRRVLAFATATAPPGSEALDASVLRNRLTMLALVGFIDPPRPEAIAAVAECVAAGIRVKMITGDHAATASAIGREIGLLHADRVLTGSALARMSDSDLAAAVLDTDVFARTSPEDKLRLVTALQAHGLTVAMTGDGVNDAPALKRADAGIAMGRKGSDAAREAADLVLADDNFASIVAAVREGRTVYDNIRKVISWTLPTNAGESLTIVVALLAGMALPVSAVQILWINLITGITLGLTLAFEPTEANTMRRPPRRRHEPLLGGALVWHILFVSGLFLAFVFGIFFYAMERGYEVELARTMAVNMLVVLEIFHLFFIRNIHGTSLTWRAVRGTRAVWAALAIILPAQFAVTYAPVLQGVFGTRAIGLLDGLLIVVCGAAFFAVIEIEKQLRLRLYPPANRLPA